MSQSIAPHECNLFTSLRMNEMLVHLHHCTVPDVAFIYCKYGDFLPANIKSVHLIPSDHSVTVCFIYCCKVIMLKIIEILIIVEYVLMPQYKLYISVLQIFYYKNILTLTLLSCKAEPVLFLNAQMFVSLHCC